MEIASLRGRCVVVRGGRRRGRPGGVTVRGRARAVVEAGGTGRAEALRELRAQLRLRTGEHGDRVLLLADQRPRVVGPTDLLGARLALAGGRGVGPGRGALAGLRRGAAGGRRGLRRRPPVLDRRHGAVPAGGADGPLLGVPGRRGPALGAVRVVLLRVRVERGQRVPRVLLGRGSVVPGGRLLVRAAPAVRRRGGGGRRRRRRRRPPGGGGGRGRPGGGRLRRLTLLRGPGRSGRRRRIVLRGGGCGGARRGGAGGLRLARGRTRCRSGPVRLRRRRSVGPSLRRGRTFRPVRPRRAGRASAGLCAGVPGRRVPTEDQVEPRADAEHLVDGLAEHAVAAPAEQRLAGPVLLEADRQQRAVVARDARVVLHQHPHQA